MQGHLAKMKDFTSDTVLLKGSREHNSESPNSNIGSNLLQFIAELRQLPGPCDILCSYTDFLYEIEVLKVLYNFPLVDYCQGLAEKNNGYDITLVVIRAPNEDFCKVPNDFCAFLIVHPQGNRKVVWKEDDKALLSFVTEDNANTERSEDKASEPSIARIEGNPILSFLELYLIVTGYFTGLMKINSHSVERIVSFFERTSTKQLKLLEFFKLLIGKPSDKCPFMFYFIFASFPPRNKRSEGKRFRVSTRKIPFFSRNEGLTLGERKQRRGKCDGLQVNA